MRWKPVSKLTDKILEDAGWSGRLMFWNSCNGPHHCISPINERYFYADDVRNEGCWEKFLVLPEAP